jgi:hypothetical protein
MALARYQGRGSSNSQASSQTGADIGEIAKQIKSKVKHPTLVNGEVELDVQRIPELLSVGGGECIGPLQGDLQATTVFAAGIVASAKEQNSGRALRTFSY